MLRLQTLQSRLWLALVAALSVAQHRAQIDGLSTLVFSDLNRLLSSLDGKSPILIRDTLLEVCPELVAPYLTASGDLTAAWYEDLRRDALGGTFYATSSGEVNKQQLDALVRYGVSPLFGQSASTVLSLIGGGMQRMVAGASRDTVVGNARKDVVSTSWARVARPGACEFCAMLAGRGAVYRSAANAGMVIGRGVDPSAAFDENGKRKRGGIGKGVQARGSRAVGADKYHDFCRCTAEPTFYTVGSYTDSRTGRVKPALMPIK